MPQDVSKFFALGVRRPHSEPNLTTPVWRRTSGSAFALHVFWVQRGLSWQPFSSASPLSLQQGLVRGLLREQGGPRAQQEGSS